MKRILLFVLVMMLCASALADVDLSKMSYAELIELRQKIDEAIWASDGWQEVTVPAGGYTIGEDIPAGKWTVKGDDIICMVTVYKTKADHDNQTANIVTIMTLQSGNICNLDLASGEYIKIDNGKVVFSPFTGAALGFK